MSSCFADPSRDSDRKYEQHQPWDKENSPCTRSILIKARSYKHQADKQSKTECPEDKERPRCRASVNRVVKRDARRLGCYYSN